MTPYQQGFIAKCAEYGLNTRQSVKLMKAAAPVEWDLWSKPEHEALHKPVSDLGRFIADYNVNPQRTQLLMQLNDNGDVVEEYTDNIPMHDRSDYDPKDLTQNQLRLFWTAKRNILRAMKKAKIKKLLLDIKAGRTRLPDGSTAADSYSRGSTNFDEKSEIVEGDKKLPISTAFLKRPKPYSRFEEIPKELEGSKYLEN